MYLAPFPRKTLFQLSAFCWVGKMFCCFLETTNPGGIGWRGRKWQKHTSAFYFWGCLSNFCRENLKVEIQFETEHKSKADFENTHKVISATLAFALGHEPSQRKQWGIVEGSQPENCIPSLWSQPGWMSYECMRSCIKMQRLHRAPNSIQRCEGNLHEPWPDTRAIPSFSFASEQGKEHWNAETRSFHTGWHVLSSRDAKHILALLSESLKNGVDFQPWLRKFN